MADTSAQANALIIRTRMRGIRAGLSQHVREVKHDAQQLTDWKFYIRKYPSVLLPLMSLLAFAIVPKAVSGTDKAPLNFLSSPMPVPSTMTARVENRSFLAGIGAAIAGMVMRSATSFAIAKATEAFSRLTSEHSAKSEPLPLNSHRS